MATGGAQRPVTRLAVWSGPRNISTALMRSWENRPDTIVIDEPLYAHYLNATGLDHPGREEVIGTGETDWRKVVATLLGPVPDGTKVFYQKHMAHHLLPGIDRGWVAGLTNVLLIRDPREVVASYVRSRADVTADDLGLPQQIQLYDELAAAGTPPPVIDARDFLLDPESYLRAMCRHVGVDFTARGCWRGRRVVGTPTVCGAGTGTTPCGDRPGSPSTAPEIHSWMNSRPRWEACVPMRQRLHEARWVV